MNGNAVTRQEYGANAKLRDDGGLLPVHTATWP